jgi:hypothetical protein
MRQLRQLSLAIALTLALGISAFAGIIETSPEAPPPPTGSGLTASTVVALIQVAVP